MVTTAASLVVALAAQWDLVVPALRAVPADRWGQPSVLAAWRVADLGGHLVRSAHSTDAIRAAPPGARAEPLAAYIAQYSAAAPDISADAIATAAHRSPGEIADIVSVAAYAQVDLLAELAARPGAERLVVAASRGPLRLVDVVATSLVEVVVHADDLARSLDAEPALERAAFDRAALGAVCRTLAAIIAERHPGHAVELRVPPFAAVQCVEGPRHTRGTPPNVVETDPVSWLRLATGRSSWADLVRDGRVRASGDRSDLSALLPLL